MLLGGVLLGVIGVMLFQAIGTLRERPEKVQAESQPPGVVQVGVRASWDHYEAGRRRMNATATILHADSWGCTWLTGGVSIEAPSVEERPGTVKMTALSGLLGPKETKLAAFGGGVEIEHSDGSRMVGDALLIEDQDAEMRGNPAKMITAEGDEVYAPRFVRFGEELRGDGRVSVRRFGGGLVPGFDGETWIEADRFASMGEDAVFEGDARAWSGSDLIQADTLHAARGGVIAVGSVRVDLRNENAAQIEAQRLERREGVTVFSGGVRFIVDASSGFCDVLAIDESGPLRSLSCTDADITAPGHGIERLTADLVVDHGGGSIEAWGSPAVLIRTDGPPDAEREGMAGRFKRMAAPRITYDQATGRATAGGAT